MNAAVVGDVSFRAVEEELPPPSKPVCRNLAAEFASSSVSEKVLAQQKRA